MEQRPAAGPINRAGEWWHQRPDGGWWKWNVVYQRWDEHPTPPPPPEPWASPEAMEVQIDHSPSEVEIPSRVDPSRSHAPTPGSSELAGAHPLRPAYVLPDGRALPPLAKWWQRLLAWMLDAVIVGSAAGIVLAVTRAVAGTDSDGSSAILVVTVGLVAVLVPAYFVLFHATTGVTVGKRVLGIRLCDKDTGGSIGYGRAYVRSLLTGLLWMVLYVAPVNYLWPLWDPQKQAWHDKAVNSIVLTSSR